MENSESKVSVMNAQGLRQGNSRKAVSRFGDLRTKREDVLKEEAFHAMLTLERRRAQRSRRPFVLMLLDTRAVHKMGASPKFIEQLTSVVSNTTRETDLIGWHQQGEILGVLFTEINLEGESPVTEILQSKVEAVLRSDFDQSVVTNLVVTTHVFPETWDQDRPDRMADLKIYPDLSRKVSKKRLPHIIKRGMDIAGSSLLLLFLSPVLAAIAVAIKLTSEGPIILEQERLGQFGVIFKCLKFRTMYTNNDAEIHRDYVRSFIGGKTENEDRNEGEGPVYKIQNDPRVTPVGKFLRKTSLDELPQFWNVLRNEMSMVGPRPPLPYEFEVYDYWHRRRVLEMKPGVTGLWQVSGRSRVCFDDMVRLDLRYSESWSLWLDLKILFATPLAVLAGSGAF
jgi:lipopolysaccharide/colanic/teichoic acid biosynthesis glycosyltransferase